jgi:hypothetical protein
LPAQDYVVVENLPSNVAATEMLFCHFISMEAEASAALDAAAAPLTIKNVPTSRKGACV